MLIDSSGERSFVHCVGAPRLLDRETLFAKLDLFAKSRAMLIGYYPLMTRLQADLPEVFAAIRKTGCLTALDAAGDGGTMDPLARILPYTDFYVPSESEAAHQTGRTDPRAMIAAYREVADIVTSRDATGRRLADARLALEASEGFMDQAALPVSPIREEEDPTTARELVLEQSIERCREQTRARQDQSAVLSGGTGT